jgi:DNA-binding XRE family transcriptional regulator
MPRSTSSPTSFRNSRSRAANLTKSALVHEGSSRDRSVVPKAAYAVDAKQTRRQLGRALAALRGHSGLTQEQLAGRLDVDPTYVSRVERGRQGVRWYTVVRFLTALEATQHQLADALDTKD